MKRFDMTKVKAKYGEKDTVLQVRINKELKSILEQHAKEKRQDVSTFVRNTIIKELGV